MRYYANPCSPAVRDHMMRGTLGWIDTPRQGNARPPGVNWCADNGAYTAKWDERTWWGWLRSHADDTTNCAFATAPDVVADAQATLARSLQWLPRIRALGYPAALALQDGMERQAVPWDDVDVLFIGGSTGWKLGPYARALTSEATERGVPVHMGRVNSFRRYRYARAIGCTSVDGTFLTYGPDRLLPELLGWLRDADQPPLI